MSLAHWRSRAVSALSKSLSRLPADHRASLDWFHERRGQRVSIPKRLNGTALLNAQTGIQKPKELRHALTVKETLARNYLNFLERRSDGSWLYVYAQQKADAFGSERSTNNSVARCAADDVPVAVVIQTRAKGPALYEVLGLARVVGWSDEFFRFEGYNDSGEIGTQGSFSESPSEYQSITPGDWRKKIMAEIAVRQGGKQFRESALLDYGHRCALTGCIEPKVLEAAHVVPYMGEDSNKRDNALLLRADLHILFDREAIWIDPDTLTLKIAKPLKGSDYAGLDGMKVTLPEAIDTESFRRRLSERDTFLAAKLAKKSDTAKV